MSLPSLLQRVLAAPSPFYRQRVLDAGGATIEAFARLPLTTRAELLRDQLEHLPHGTRRFADAAAPVRAGVSGSGKDLLVLTWTAADLVRERAAGARMLRRLGITAGMRIANTLPGALATPGSLLLGDVVEELGGLDVPLGEITSEAAARAAWELIDRVQPVVLILASASASRLFDAAPPGPRPWWVGVVRTYDGSTRHDAVPAALGFTGWERRWLAVPEATSFVASSCSGNRWHVDDEVIVEVAPHNGATALVITALGVDTPALRYLTGIGCRLHTTPCPCGGAGVTIMLD